MQMDVEYRARVCRYQQLDEVYFRFQVLAEEFQVLFVLVQYFVYVCDREEN